MSQEVTITEIDPGNRRQVNKFLKLPFRLYKNTPQWVPPLEIDIRRVFNTRKHPFYRKGTAAFFLAERDGEVLGRLAVLNDRLYNTTNHSQEAYFYLFECEQDQAIANVLFSRAEDWCRKEGLNRITGPKGFSILDGFGLLGRGFEHRPAFGLPYNLPYYPALIEAQGFIKTSDTLSGYLDASLQIPEKILRVAELLKERRGLHVPELRTRNDLRRMIPKLKELYNGALGGTGGGVPLSDEEVDLLASQLLWFADPKLIKIVMKGDQPVGFLFAYPDVSAAVQRVKGKVFPFGWIHLWLELRRTKWININGAGMIEGYRGLGGTALLFSQMYQSVAQGRYRYADVVQIGAENDRMLRELREVGVDFYKSHYTYQKDLL
jgi:hypothetical protein